MSELSDGFGDRWTPAELVAMHEPLARLIAAERQSPDAPYEDLVQEARISIWRLAMERTGKDNLRGLASVAIRRRITEVSMRQTWTGYVSHRGHPTGSTAWPTRVDGRHRRCAGC